VEIDASQARGRVTGDDTFTTTWFCDETTAEAETVRSRGSA